MSSATATLDKGLFSTFLAVHHPMSADEAAEAEEADKPVEQPAEKPADAEEVATA